VTALQPEEFLAGSRSSGTALPHARVAIEPDDVVSIESESLFRGYWPDERRAGKFVTEDLARIDEHQQLHILGRRDATIITGGKKVHPADVEAALRASGEFQDIAVIGVPDREWGEKVIACYPRTSEREPSLERAIAQLAPEQKPKHFIALDQWPRNQQGKVNRATLRELAVEKLSANLASESG
jgi:o-succinylbenzoate---CoA ligase